MSDRSYSAPALEKGIEIIEFLSSRAEPATQKEIAAALGRTPSEIFRMLVVLVDRGFVLRGNDDRFSLTLRLLSLAQQVPALERLRAFALPRMRALVQNCWQSCHIGVEENGNIVIIEALPSPGHWGLMIRPGAVIGLTNTSTGRVMAAFRDPVEAEALYDNHAPAMGEVKADKPAFLKRLTAIREQGCEITPSDTTEGVTNMAFPVLDASGRAIAVVNCPYLKRLDSLAVPDQDVVIARYRAFASALSAFSRGQYSKGDTA